MDTEAKNKDHLLLNALVDGELAPQERAEMAARLAADRDFARAHATLARLKANGVRILEELPPTNGRRVCFLEAPDGAQIEIIERV